MRHKFDCKIILKFLSNLYNKIFIHIMVGRKIIKYIIMVCLFNSKIVNNKYY